MRKMLGVAGLILILFLSLPDWALAGEVNPTGAEKNKAEQNEALRNETENGAEQNETDQEQIQGELLGKLDTDELNQFMAGVFPGEKHTFTGTLMGLMSGDIKWSLSLVGDCVRDRFFYELKTAKAGMIHIIILALVAALFANFSGVFQNTQVAEISFSMLYMLLVTICLTGFRTLANGAAANVSELTGFMKLLGPVYVAALAMAKGSATSLMFYQLVLIAIFMVELLIKNFLLPLAGIYMIVRLLGELSTEIRLTKFAELIETLVNWTLKTLLAGIVGLSVIQSLLSPAVDSVKRSVITRSGEAIPVIGDIIGGTAEVVVSAAVLIKNGIGVLGMCICLAVILAPVFQMALTAILYQLTAAIIQPISDKRMVSCISAMAEGCKMLLRIVWTTGLLFLVTLAVVSVTTSGT